MLRTYRIERLSSLGKYYITNDDSYLHSDGVWRDTTSPLETGYYTTQEEIIAALKLAGYLTTQEEIIAAMTATHLTVCRSTKYTQILDFFASDLIVTAEKTKVLLGVNALDELVDLFIKQFQQDLEAEIEKQQTATAIVNFPVH